MNALCFLRIGEELTLVQEVDIKKSLALDLVFHKLPATKDQITAGIVLGLGMDNGTVGLYSLSEKGQEIEFSLCSTLLKHEDWVRCISFITLSMRFSLITATK